MSGRGSGLSAWLIQRASAVYMAIFIPLFVIAVWLHTPLDYYQWQAFIAHPVTSLSTALFFLVLFGHAWVGVRDIVIDYIHPLAARMTTLTIVALALLGLALWVARILL